MLFRSCASGDPAITSINDPGANGSSDQDCETLGGSLSVMHIDSGIFATVAAGVKNDNLRKSIFANRAPNGIQNIDDQDWFWGAQAGIERKFIELGKTTFYGEFTKFEAGAQIGDTRGDIRTFNAAFNDLGPDDNFSRGSEVRYWGLGVNQHIDAAEMDLYAAYRHFEADVTLSDATDTGTIAKFGIGDLDIVMTGAMIKF